MAPVQLGEPGRRPGTPAASGPAVEACGRGALRSSRNIVAVAAAGAVSREVERRELAVDPQHGEAAAEQVAGLRVHDGEGEGDRHHRRVDRVAAGAQDGEAGCGRGGLVGTTSPAEPMRGRRLGGLGPLKSEKRNAAAASRAAATRRSGGREGTGAGCRRRACQLAERAASPRPAQPLSSSSSS